MDEKPKNKGGRPSKHQLVNGMTRMMERFAIEYAIDQNGTRAAVAAGYSPNVAGQQASMLLRDKRIQDAIDKQRRDSVRKFKMRAEDILEDLAKVAMDEEISPHKMKALELLGKHFQLFVEKVEISVDTLPAEERAARAAALLDIARARLAASSREEEPVGARQTACC
jgi:phage terminase small subunit